MRILSIRRLCGGYYGKLVRFYRCLITSMRIFSFPLLRIPPFPLLRISHFPSLRLFSFPSLQLFSFTSLRGAKRRTNLIQQSDIANRRVGRCVGVKQSPHFTSLLVLSVLRRLLRSLRSFAMTVWGCRLAMTQ